MSNADNFYPASPTEIRDGTFARVQASALGFKNVYRQRTTPAKNSDLPLAALWTVRDATTPNGDANAGAPSFVHNLIMAIDVVISGSDDDALDATLTAMAEGLRDTLLTDGSWRQLFEGMERCAVHYSYPPTGDLTLGIATIEIEVTVRSEWPPVAENDFAQVVVTTNPPGVSPPRRFDGYVTNFPVLGCAR